MKSILTAVFYFTLLIALQSCDKIPGLQSEMKDDDAKAKQALIGVWRGEGGYEGEEDAGWSESWKIERNADGKYSVDYLILNDDEKLYELSSDAGSWSYENGVYYEINSNGDKVIYDVYSVKDDWFEYNIADRQGSANIQETKTVDTFQLQSPPKGYSLVTYDQSTDELNEKIINETLNESSDEEIVESIDELVKQTTDQLDK